MAAADSWPRLTTACIARRLKCTYSILFAVMAICPWPQRALHQTWPKQGASVVCRTSISDMSCPRLGEVALAIVRAVRRVRRVVAQTDAVRSPNLPRFSDGSSLGQSAKENAHGPLSRALIVPCEVHDWIMAQTWRETTRKTSPPVRTEIKTHPTGTFPPPVSYTPVHRNS